MKAACGEQKEALDAEQQALKILANATSYGIFVELIVEELNKKEGRLCFGSGNGRQSRSAGTLFSSIAGDADHWGGALDAGDNRTACNRRGSRLGHL
jgi:hypothetical protein